MPAPAKAGVVTPAAKRQAVSHLREMFDVSERRACVVVGADRASMRYQSLRGDDAGLRDKLRVMSSRPVGCSL